MTTAKVFLLSNNILLCSALKHALESKSKDTIKVVGEARNGQQALKILSSVNPEIVLMDAHLTDVNSLEWMPKVLRLYPDIKILIITAQSQNPFLAQFLKLGASGCFTRDSTLDELITGIQNIKNGGFYLSGTAANEIAMQKIQGNKGSFEDISSREMQVVMCLIEGLDVAEVANKLHLSPKTVCSYRYRIYDKLLVKNDVQLIHVAMQHGIWSQS